MRKARTLFTKSISFIETIVHKDEFMPCIVTCAVHGVSSADGFNNGNSNLRVDPLNGSRSVSTLRPKAKS